MVTLLSKIKSNQATVPEPKVVEREMLQCPMCNRIFASKKDYIHHARSQHSPIPESSKG